MKTPLLVLTAFLLALMMALAAAPTRLMAQATDPASVYTALVTAQNAHNADAAAALFADNATVVVNETAYSSKTSIAAWLQGQATANYHDASGTPQVTGDTLLVQDQISTDALTQEGLAPISENIQVVVSNGKISTYVARLTLPSEQAVVAAFGKVKPPTDPISVVTAVQTADNAGDTATSASYYADDAVIAGTPTATDSGIYTGKDAIAGYLQQQTANHIKISGAIRVMVGPNTVLSTAFVTNDAWTKLGVAPLEVYSYFVVVNGKIEQQVVNLTPGSLLKLAAANKTS